VRAGEDPDELGGLGGLLEGVFGSKAEGFSETVIAFWSGTAHTGANVAICYMVHNAQATCGCACVSEACITYLASLCEAEP